MNTATRASPSSAPRRRSGRRRRASAGDLGALQRELWYGLRRVGEVFDQPEADPSEVCKAANALAALANAYRAVAETVDLAREVAELREDLEAVKDAQNASRYPRAA